MSYDAAGNQTQLSVSPGGTVASYDAEGRMAEVTIDGAAWARYGYDAEGRRVKKSVWNIDHWATTYYVYDAAGQLMAEYGGSGTESGTQYVVADYLGSTRLLLDGQGACEGRIDYAPFGAMVRQDCDAPGSGYPMFTGKERDRETGQDYFGARYFWTAMGRFTTVDPIFISRQRLDDPQQWNNYEYGRNNPLRFVDPTGKRVELVGTDEERNKLLQALKNGVGKEAAAYLTVKKDSGFLGLGKTRYYVSTTNRKAFAATNVIANKMGGLINDSRRTAVVQLVAPGKQISSLTIGSIQQGRTPAVTGALPTAANVSITSGALGSVPGNLLSNHQNTPATLPEVLIHELGHVDAAWYHGGFGLGAGVQTSTNGDAVRIENQVRKLEGTPLRLGHDVPFDVPLTGVPY